MNLYQRKMELVDKIIHAEDQTVLKKIETIFSEEESLNLKKYPNEIQKSIKRGLEDIKNNRVVSNASMKKKYSKWLSK